jgi:hypothetical protein
VPVDEDPDLVCAGVGCYAGTIVPQGAELVPVQHVTGLQTLGHHRH